MDFNSQTLDLSTLDEATFVEHFGAIYEHSPWVAQQVWTRIQNLSSISYTTLTEGFRYEVDQASEQTKLVLLRAHPDLAGKAASDGTLTADSTTEQASARLDLCTEEQLQRFKQLNTDYKNTFGFPFIMAVRNSTREEILASFEARLGNTAEQEFDTALEQVHRIGLLRLAAYAASHSTTTQDD